MAQLYKRVQGGGEHKLIILHGLFGSSKNWISVASALKFDGQIISLDARNHGQSFHAESHTLDDMVNDLRNFIVEEGIKKVTLLGHSMGGLTAMVYALKYPQEIEKLIVVDIAPRSYTVDYREEFEALQLDLTNFQSRKQIDEQLQGIVDDLRVRQFLQTNIERNEKGYYWVLNVPVLKNADYRGKFEFHAEGRKFPSAALFIKGGKSKFINDQDLQTIKQLFPAAEIKTLPEGDHWLHYSDFENFINSTNEFLNAV
ncbi:MAG: alpha/beta fold hydrolase [Leptospiraceae bacterium]|nr:alpha/beta fold hydrolase [Leptospiraceae bacterium]